MKILLITFIYNELPYLKDMISYYKSQGCDLYFIDNYSTDGGYEYLKKRKIKCTRLNTKNSFNLTALQNEVEKRLHNLKPGWVVYAHPDLFYVFKQTIKETIKVVESKGHNQISVSCYGALNTGEKFKTPLYKNYFYGVYYRDLIMISKYDPGLKMDSDNIIIPDANPLKVEGIMVNYGACKPLKDQKIKLKRREKAWKEGLSKNIGKHFKSGEKIKWEWDRKKTINFHRCIHAKLFKKLYREG